MDYGFWIALILLVGIGIFLVTIYNKLVSLRNRFKNGFAQIDVQLNRRYDLIPNLIETTKAYLQHEKETLENVIQARNGALSATQAAAAHPEDGAAIKNLNQAEAKLDSALGRLLMLSESYPDLKANQTIQELMESLSSTENKIAFARQAYNDAVMHYNEYREQFPNLFIANNFAFSAAEYLELPDEKMREAIKVSFNKAP